MRITAKAEYACLALIALARRDLEKRPIHIREIAHEEGIPESTLTQILVKLKRAGLVRSTRGSTGGYSLAHPPEEITLGRILLTIDGENGATRELQGSSARALASVWDEILRDRAQAAGADLDRAARGSIADLQLGNLARCCAVALVSPFASLAMGRLRIDDLDDPRIAIYRSLKSTNQTRRLDQFVVEGERLVERLLASRFPTTSILMTDRHEPRLLSRIPEGVPAFVLPHVLVDTLVGFPFHRGVLASGFRLAWPSLDDVVQAGAGRLTLVICPKLSNPENLGAIARIGDVFGIDAILSGPTCPDPLSSASSEFRWARC